MRVKVLPPHGCDRSALDERCWMELPEGAIQMSCTSSTPFFLQNSEKGRARSFRFSFSPLTGSLPGVTAKPS